MPPLDYDPWTRTVTIGPDDRRAEVTVAEIFAAGRGEPVTELEPALALAVSLTDHPHLIARLGDVSTGTAGYIHDPRLRELVHRHLVAAIAASGTLPTGWQKVAEWLGGGRDAVAADARLLTQAAIRTHLGVAAEMDARILPDDSTPAQVLGEIAMELAAPQLAVETFPSWLGALGPLLVSPVTAAAVVEVFSRTPWGKPHRSAQR